MTKKSKVEKPVRDQKRPPHSVNMASRSGSNAGRGFRYQDAVAGWLAVEIWAGQQTPGIMIPEGGDDIELRGEESAFIQVKSRREHLGNYPQGEIAEHVGYLWKRAFSSSPQPGRLCLILERGVTGFSSLNAQPSSSLIGSPIAAKLEKLSYASTFFSKTVITVTTSPQESAISRIAERLNCSPIAAQICFAELLVRVGALADANARLTQENYRGLSISDTEAAIHGVLSAVDISTIEHALREGVCEPVDFLIPLNDPNFYLGIDVEPGHIAAGLVSERPHSRSALVKGIEERRAALIIGPSGAGKSAVMWQAANMLRHTVRWFRIRRLSMSDIPAVRQLIRTFRASADSPMGFVMDDIGRNNPESWGALLKEVMSVPGVVLLGSIREEDATLITERARTTEVRLDPDDELAERLWQELREAGKTDWAGWREPWKMSDGLLLEYAHILTRGRRMKELLADQVAARILDPTRSLELDILRAVAWAGSANAEIDASRLARTLSASESDLSRALQRLTQEHLIRSVSPGALAGLHQLRSKELLRLTHQTQLPTLEASFDRAVASMSPDDLEFLVSASLSERHLPVSAVLSSLVARLELEPDARVFASVLRGLGAGRIVAGVDDWLASPETRALPRTQVTSAAMFGIAGVDLSSLDILPEIQIAAKRLSQIKGSPEDDPRRRLIEDLSEFCLSSLIRTDDLGCLEEILKTLVGMPLSMTVRSALMDVPTNLLNADLHVVASLMGTLTILDREIAIHWAAIIGQEDIFAKIQKENSWIGPVSIANADEGVIVHCDFWYVAGSIQGNPHDAVVSLCELILALCPSADIAMSKAISASGKLAGIAEMPLAEKRIPRNNLPPSSLPQWNKQWLELIARRVSSSSYSEYLSRSVAILERLEPVLHKIFDAHLRKKDVLKTLFETLNLLNAETEDLTPPSISSMEASGVGSEEQGLFVTRFQHLLNCTSVNLIKRFAKLPEHAGAYIGWLNDLLADLERVISEEPWHLISTGPPPALSRLRTLLEAIRQLAGEAHERQKAPVTTWSARVKGSRKGNALHLAAYLATGENEERLTRRKAYIERLAEESGIKVIFHLRLNDKGSLPWPPVDVLALLPATDIAVGGITLAHQLDLLRSLVDSSFHMTVMPLVDNVAFPMLARSGYRTLFPDTDGALIWAESLGLTCAPMELSVLFGETIGLATELGALHQLRLGTDARPEQEKMARKCLEQSFTEKRDKLFLKLASFGCNIQPDIDTLLDHLQTKDIDLMTESQAVFEGTGSEMTHIIGYLQLRLIECEWLAQ